MLLIGLLLLTLTFINELYKIKSTLSNVLYVLFIPIALTIMLTSALHYTPMKLIVIIYGIFIATQLIVPTISAIVKGNIDGIFILFYLICFISNSIWELPLKLL